MNLNNKSTAAAPGAGATFVAPTNKHQEAEAVPQDDVNADHMEIDEESKQHEDLEPGLGESEWVNASDIFPQEEPTPRYECPQSVIAVVGKSPLIDAKELARLLSSSSNKRVVVAKDCAEASMELRSMRSPDIVLVENATSVSDLDAIKGLAPMMLLSWVETGVRNASPTDEVELYFATQGIHRQILLEDGDSVRQALHKSLVALDNPSLDIISVA